MGYTCYTEAEIFNSCTCISDEVISSVVVLTKNYYRSRDLEVIVSEKC